MDAENFWQDIGPRVGPAAPTVGIITAELVHELSEAVRGVEGVAELAPTLTDRALRLGQQLLSQQAPVTGQGIDVRLAGDAVLVSVDVAVGTWYPTLAAARQIQQVVRSVLAAHRLRCSSVTVSVLALHPGVEEDG